jgi:hypothetical protein
MVLMEVYPVLQVALQVFPLCMLTQPVTELVLALATLLMSGAVKHEAQ